MLMDEHALEAQGVAALGAKRKMLKTFEVVRGKWASRTRTRHRPHRCRLIRPRVYSWELDW